MPLASCQHASYVFTAFQNCATVTSPVIDVRVISTPPTPKRPSIWRCDIELIAIGMSVRILPVCDSIRKSADEVSGIDNTM